MKTLVALVGARFRGDEMVRLLASLPQGEQLKLVREPNNAYDGNAVQVWARGHHIGYLKGTQNKSVAMAMDSAIPAKDFVGKLSIDGGRFPMVEIDL